MKIYTKKGDKGFTTDLNGEKVKKNSTKINLQGSLDEANAYIGICRSYEIPDKIDVLLKNVQYKLYLLGIYTSKDDDQEFSKLYTEELEEFIDSLEKDMPRQTSFLYYSGHISSTSVQYLRSIIRRVEREFVDYMDENSVKMENSLSYVNRLSDCLFVIGRYLNYMNNVEEEKMELK